MSLLFWRKTNNTSDDNNDGTINELSVPVTESRPLPVQIFNNEDEDTPKVEISQSYLPPVPGQQITRMYKVPGVTTGGAYADGDAMGTLITFHDVFRPEKRSGIVVGAFIIDKDDEGLQIDIPLFVRTFATTTNDSAFAPSDDDLMHCRAVVAVSSFSNWGSNQFGQATNQGIWISGEDTNLYSQLVARGAINLAAGSEPWVGLVVIPD